MNHRMYSKANRQVELLKIILLRISGENLSSVEEKKNKQ